MDEIEKAVIVALRREDPRGELVKDKLKDGGGMSVSSPVGGKREAVGPWGRIIGGQNGLLEIPNAIPNAGDLGGKVGRDSTIIVPKVGFGLYALLIVETVSPDFAPEGRRYTLRAMLSGSEVGSTSIEGRRA